jgi:anaerobic magnesium-protoporphyrin IX monomethyl ester cyclase
MAAQVPQLKFVDRTFNYQNQRSRDIFNFILENNISSHFHFEIGAHLLDEETLQLLEKVPPGMFQFEIGVQSTLPATLQKISRQASLEKLAENVQRLRRQDNIHLHLDLIAGLPGESYSQCLQSLDWTAALRPHHLQLEPVKLLPGAPLRAQAEELGIFFDPNPPYSLLRSADISYHELEKLRGISRLLDLLANSGRFAYLLPLLISKFGGLSACLEELDCYWREADLYQGPIQLRATYLRVDNFLQSRLSEQEVAPYREALARDYAHNERVVSGSQPDFFTQTVTAEERQQVRRQVKEEIAGFERSGKIQFFAAPFEHLTDYPGRVILIFLYQTKTKQGLRVKEIALQN